MNGVVLNQVEHSRILADMENVSITAGVQGKFLYESMKKYCGEQEVEWVQHFHKHRKAGLPGLMLEGCPHPDTRCQAIAAALIRNYIDARCISLNQMVDIKLDSIPNPTVLLIPNLFVAPVAVSKGVAPWKVQIIYDLLLQRAVQNKPTVVWVESLDLLGKAYGIPFRDFLTTYKVVAGDKVINKKSA